MEYVEEKRRGNKISEKKKFEIKRVHAEWKRVLQYRKRLDAFKSELGWETMSTPERRDAAAAIFLAASPEDRQFLMFDDLQELGEELMALLERMVQTFVDRIERIEISIQDGFFVLGKLFLGEAEIIDLAPKEKKEGKGEPKV